MDDDKDLKRNDQIKLLKVVQEYTDTGIWTGAFTYPNCGIDLVNQGLATLDKKITKAGRAALFLLNEGGKDPTNSKATIPINIKFYNEK